MQEVISSVIITLLTQAVKKWPKITIVNEGQAGRIRLVVALLAVISTILTAWVSGTIGSIDTITVIGQSLTTFILSTLTYFGVGFVAR